MQAAAQVRKQGLKCGSQDETPCHYAACGDAYYLNYFLHEIVSLLRTFYTKRATMHTPGPARGGWFRLRSTTGRPLCVSSVSLRDRASRAWSFGFAQGPGGPCASLRLRPGTGRRVRVPSASLRDRASRACLFGFAQGPGDLCASLRLRSGTVEVMLRDRRSDAQGPSRGV
jgi:hypothetical protein